MNGEENGVNGESMIEKILRRESGLNGCCESGEDGGVKKPHIGKKKNGIYECDEFASDEMELAAIGKSEYFSTCEYKMISGDGNLTGQGS